MPFHDGVPDVAMGAGPGAILDGWSLPDSRVETVPAPDPARPEVARTIELNRCLSGRVAEAVAAGAFPVVLSGGCNACLGTVGGIGGGDLGVVWFDAHADFDTPEDNRSGFFDVMVLAALTGSAWQAQVTSIPGLRPVPEDRVVLAGVRDVEPYQRERMERSRLHVVPGALDGFAAALDALPVSRVYLHLDLDALDVSEGRANEYAAPGGPSLAAYLAAVDEVFDRFSVAAVALTAYDPAFDDDGRAQAAARALLERVAARVG